MALNSKQINALKINIPIWVSLFQKLGVDDYKIPFLLSQMALETGYFTSDPYLIDNNPGGITWNKNYLTRPGASIGKKRPARETGNYVHFDTLENAAIDYIRILKRTPGVPLNAANIDDFAAKLAQNGYYDQTFTPISSYTNSLKSIYNNIDKTVDVATILKKKTNLMTAAITPIMALIVLGWLYFKK